MLMPASSQPESWNLENGGNLKGSRKEIRHGRTAHNMSSSSLRKKSDLSLISKVPCGLLRLFLSNLQEVILGTKLFVLFPAVPLAIIAVVYKFGTPWVFALSLLGLTPLAERVSFLTEQIAFFTGPTVGGLLNATCGNATELIIALLALRRRKIAVVKCSLLGSVLSNLLLVLGTSLFCGGLANIKKEQKYDRKQADVNSLLLLLGLLCQMLPLLFKYANSATADILTANSTLQLSRVSSIIMLLAYAAYLFFQLKTHRQLFEALEEEDGDEVGSEEEAVISFWSAFAWLVGMTAVIALLSEYVVATIEHWLRLAGSPNHGSSMFPCGTHMINGWGCEQLRQQRIFLHILAHSHSKDASESWGISVNFISIILLPIVGNAAEHAGAIIFAFKNKLDISLGVALGSATQISMFVVPLSVLVAWIMGIDMDLDFNILETAALALSVIVTAFTLQDGTSHYMKGFVLLLCYIVIGTCFFVIRTPLHKENVLNLGADELPTGGVFVA